MNKKIIVLGSTGLIGHEIYFSLSRDESWDVFNISRSHKLTDESLQIDILDFERFETAVREIQPDIIINCIGVLISESAKDFDLAKKVNQEFPHKLRFLCDQISAKLIHMSTDCVFSGKKLTPYIETDEKDGLDNYAITKAAGEIISEDHLTIRTSVIGPELNQDGEQLFNWFMNEQGEVNGYADAIWSGVTSLELGRVVAHLIREDIKGLYHVTNGIPITKNELLHLFKEVTNKDIDIGYLSGININKHFIDTRKLINHSIPSYEKMVKEMVQKIKEGHKRYNHYNFQ